MVFGRDRINRSFVLHALLPLKKRFIPGENQKVNSLPCFSRKTVPSNFVMPEISMLTRCRPFYALPLFAILRLMMELPLGGLI